MVAPIETADARTPGMFRTWRRFVVWALSISLIGLLLWGIAIAGAVAVFRILTTHVDRSAPR